jgi:hypothetical protein
VNEVEPWSSRVRRDVGSRIGRAWTWFTDLGQGAWMLGIGVVVVVALAVAVVQGRHDPGGSPCSLAQPYVSRMQTLSEERHHRLDAGDVTWLRSASARLTAIEGQAFGDDVSAIRLAAATSAEAEAGQRLDAGATVADFDNACGYGGAGTPGGLGSR